MCYSFNSDYDIAYVIDMDDTYSISFSGTGSCAIPPLSISFVIPEEIIVDTAVESPLCDDGSLGVFSGTIDGPVGIYEIYIKINVN